MKGMPGRLPVSKASVFGEVLGKCSRRVPRGLRGRHVAKDHQRKLRTSRGSPRQRRICTAKAARISRESGEVGMCPRLGRMGSIKRRWTGTE